MPVMLLLPPPLSPPLPPPSRPLETLPSLLPALQAAQMGIPLQRACAAKGCTR